MTTFMSCSISRMVRPKSSRRDAYLGHQVLLLLRVHAGGGFVEQEQFGLGGEGAGDFQAALLAVG